MKRTTIHIFAAIALLFALAACTQDEAGFLPEGAEGTPIVFTATGLNPVATAIAGTRAPVDGNWEGVQSVAVLMDGTVKAYDVTLTTAEPTNATLTSTDPHYWTNREDITVTAWWPYTEGETTPPAVKVKANQSAQKDFEGSDLIVADGQTVTYGSPTLRFTHRTARVTIELKPGTGFTSVDGATVSLVSLSADNGNPTAIKTYNASGNTYEALTAPQTVEAGKPFIRVELGGGTFYFRPQNNVVLAAGNRYTYTVKVNATGLTLEGCTIGDWADGGGESGEAEDLGYSIQDDGSYMVYNADGLLAWNKAAQKDESINCTLTADIDMTGREWTRLGTWPGYSGVFNGQGHRITGLNFSAATTELFGLLNLRGVIKNLQLIDVNLYGNNGSAAGIVDQNNGQIIACSVTGKISAYGRTCGIADLNYGSITACWFDGTLKDYESGAIVRFNYNTITSCYRGGNAEQGEFRNFGGTVDATKVDGATVKWQTAVDGMNTALTENDYQWVLGTGGLPVLQKKQ